MENWQQGLAKSFQWPPQQTQTSFAPAGFATRKANFIATGSSLSLERLTESTPIRRKLLHPHYYRQISHPLLHANRSMTRMQRSLVNLFCRRNLGKTGAEKAGTAPR
jgi:hypothetical protein